MFKILQARLQWYVNWERPDVQAGFRKDRGTRDQIANTHWIIKKAREFQKNIYFCFIGASLVAQLVKNPLAMWRPEFNPRAGKIPWEVYPLQYSALENSMRCIVHEVAKSRTWLSNFHFLLCWLFQSLWLCGSQQTVENAERDGNIRPPDLPLEKSVCRSGSNS